MPIYATEHQVNEEVITINIEMDEVVAPGPYDDVRNVNAVTKKVMESARDVFGDGMELARNCATRVVESISEMPAHVCPDEFEVQFAVKLDSEVGAVIAKASTGAQLQINMKWTPAKE